LGRFGQTDGKSRDLKKSLFKLKATVKKTSLLLVSVDRRMKRLETLRKILSTELIKGAW
jgi:hypothetical protein